MQRYLTPFAPGYLDTMPSGTCIREKQKGKCTARTGVARRIPPSHSLILEDSTVGMQGIRQFLTLCCI